MNIPTESRLLLQTIWQIGKNSVPLPEAVRSRLAPYITRYAQTLEMSVYAVGGTEDHLHILHNLPLDKPLQKNLDEIQKATVRFIREFPETSQFQWADTMWIATFRAEDRELLEGYVRENAVRHQTGRIVPEWEGTEFPADAPTDSAEDALPDWMREAAHRLSSDS
ncbi:MAG: hypothetical protein OHK0029_24350 [Armatimonadaceae bacterium]